MTIEEKVREIMLSEALSDSEKLDQLHALTVTIGVKQVLFDVRKIKASLRSFRRKCWRTLPGDTCFRSL